MARIHLDNSVASRRAAASIFVNSIKTAQLTISDCAANSSGSRGSALYQTSRLSLRDPSFYSLLHPTFQFSQPVLHFSLVPVLRAPQSPLFFRPHSVVSTQSAEERCLPRKLLRKRKSCSVGQETTLRVVSYVGHPQAGTEHWTDDLRRLVWLMLESPHSSKPSQNVHSAIQPTFHMPPLNLKSRGC